jgi:Arc/MetJ-type ribon-helix-helix transcriptional regulator
MSVITVPVSDVQQAIIKEMVSSGRAATKAHAVRMAIDLLAREEALETLRRGQAEIRSGKTLKGDLDELAKHIK